MKLIRILLAHKCVKAMKHRYRDKEHQLMKIREEEKELGEAVDRKITREELRIIETTKNDNCFKYAYRLFIKGTKAEERADCFIAWAGMLATTYPRRRTYLMQATYCTSWEDVRHILLKLRYNKVRDDWLDKLR